MPDYKRMYYQLAARVADAVELLIEAQREGEDSAMQEERQGISIAPAEAQAEE